MTLSEDIQNFKTDKKKKRRLEEITSRIELDYIRQKFKAQQKEVILELEYLPTEIDISNKLLPPRLMNLNDFSKFSVSNYNGESVFYEQYYWQHKPYNVFKQIYSDGEYLMQVITVYNAKLEQEKRILVDVHPIFEQEGCFDFPSILQWNSYLYFTKRHFFEKKSRGLQLYRYDLETKEEALIESWQIQEGGNEWKYALFNQTFTLQLIVLTSEGNILSFENELDAQEAMKSKSVEWILINVE